MLRPAYVFIDINFGLHARLEKMVNDKVVGEELVSFNRNQYIPSIFVKSKEPSDFIDMYSRDNLKELKFKTGYELHQYIKNKPANVTLYGNKDRVQEYIRREFFGKTYPTSDLSVMYIDIEVRSINGYASTENPTEEVSLIQVYSPRLKKFIVLGVRDLDKPLTSSLGDVIYRKFDNEESMLLAFSSLYKRINPIVITGFNSNAFDIPYLVNRMDMLNIDYSFLSPLGQVHQKQGKSNDGLFYNGFNIVGVMQLDMRDLYIKYNTAKPPRFSLDSIAEVELGDKKVEYDGTLETLYLNDYQLFVEYGLKDVELLIRLENKLHLIEVSHSIAFMCGVNANDVSGTVKQWASLIYNEAIKDKVVVPLEQLNIVHHDFSYPGGWVRSTPNIHTKVASYDFASLYPMCMATLNAGLDTHIPFTRIPPKKLELLRRNASKYLGEEVEAFNELPSDIQEILDTHYRFYDTKLVDNDTDEERKHLLGIMANGAKIGEICKKYDISIAPNGCMYFNDSSIKSVMVRVIERVFAERKEFKKLMKSDPERYDYYDLLQYRNKILMNSLYGSLAMALTQFSFGEFMAASVTTAGRMINQMVAYGVSYAMNKKYNLGYSPEEVIHCPLTAQADTDSNYFTFSKILG